MTKTTMSLTEKLQKLEKQKLELIESRRQEILKIIEASGALSIDDRLLAGVLLFLKDENNRHHSIINEFMKYLEQKQQGRKQGNNKAPKPKNEQKKE